MIARPLFSSLLVVLLAGCAVGPDYHASSTGDLGIPAHYDRSAPPAFDERQAAIWWQRFNDPALDALVTAAVTYNLDVAQARARLVQARESAVQAGATLLPSAGATANGGRNIRSPGADSDSYSLGAQASWEIDIFGGNRRALEAARADAQAAGFNLATVHVSIIAETVTNYIQLRLAQEQLQIARETLASQDDNLQIARWRVQAGLANSLDEQQALTLRAQTAASIPSIEQNLRAALARIAVLTGQAPGEATRNLEKTGPIPLLPDDIAVGIPADTLRQRPDVRSAERTLAAQTARIGIAKAAFLPSLQISGDIGTSALTLGTLGDVVTGGLFAGLSQLLFDGGASASRVRSQRAGTEGAFAAYRQSVLSALEDVENALVANDATDERARQNTIALDAATTSALLARSQYEAGLTDFQTLLTTERSLLSSRNSEAGGRADRALASVQLYRALGGGWQDMNEVKP
tara:strand:- start:10265 stop:11659 length:1395 start_codon:yes stop_codon:yes gene_type:complete